MDSVLYVEFFSAAPTPTASSFATVFFAGSCDDSITLVQLNGTINDGSFNLPYVAGSKCQWVIKPSSVPDAPIRMIQLTFQELNVSYDTLTLQDSKGAKKAILDLSFHLLRQSNALSQQMKRKIKYCLLVANKIR